MPCVLFFSVLQWAITPFILRPRLLYYMHTGPRAPFSPQVYIRIGYSSTPSLPSCRRRSGELPFFHLLQCVYSPDARLCKSSLLSLCVFVRLSTQKMLRKKIKGLQLDFNAQSSRHRWLHDSIFSRQCDSPCVWSASLYTREKAPATAHKCHEGPRTF
jgi:hypothetical protein